MSERHGYVKNADPYLPCLPCSTVFSPIFNKKLLFATFHNKKYILGHIWGYIWGYVLY